ncbi:cupin domain-containing protein [Enterobacter soli]|uniref:cupin domain-containing protein n=1 Tax=Enterobacter soli TaxID=885040 RepID=UPI003EDB5628
MLVNHDFTQRASLRLADYQWVRSPQTGVERVMLDRIGEEKARATSIVRYSPESYFPEHQHPDGEEILVLSGVFSEGSRDYPAGWYLRNPDGSSHSPSSREGATIFVKLRQMRHEDSEFVRINTRDPSTWKEIPRGAVCPLFQGVFENVSLQRLDAAHSIHIEVETGGAEILVLNGELVEESTTLSAGSWLRVPVQDSGIFTAGREGAVFYLKTGHLRGMTSTEVAE